MDTSLIPSSLIIFSILLIGIFVLYESTTTNNINRIFFFLCISIIAWIFSNLLADMMKNDYSIIFVRFSIVGSLFIPLNFNRLIKELYNYSERYLFIHKYIENISIIFILIIILINQTSLNVKCIYIDDLGISFVPGILYYPSLIYFIITFSFPILYLIKKIKKLNGVEKIQAKLILIGSSISILLSLIINIILPLYGYSHYSIYNSISIVFFIYFISYAITRHRLFNIKIITIEIATFGLWTFALIRTLLAENAYEFYTELTILTISIILGILLIRSMMNEILQRDKIEELTINLNNAYKSIEEMQIDLEEKLIGK